MKDKPTKWEIKRQQREKRENKILFILYALVIIFFLVLCLIFSRQRWYHGKRPVDQPGSVWVSEDSNITIIVGSDDVFRDSYAIVKNGDETITFLCAFSGITTELELCSTDAREDGLTSTDEIYERWYGEVIFSDRFTATVEKTTYFEEGQKIKFYRVDE